MIAHCRNHLFEVLKQAELVFTGRSVVVWVLAWGLREFWGVGGKVLDLDVE